MKTEIDSAIYFRSLWKLNERERKWLRVSLKIKKDYWVKLIKTKEKSIAC